MIAEYINSMKLMLDHVDIKTIEKIAKTMKACTGTIYSIGNGGSASTASHFACDIMKATQNKIKVHALTDNLPIITACANDFSYDKIFIQQLINVIKPEDVVIAFSGSGNSPNVLMAVQYANLMKANTIGITGFDGGQLHKISKIKMNLPINNMQITEDLHLMIVHILMRKLQK